jgi:hypothetical protein
MKVARTGSRDAVVRAFQSRADRKNPTPTATVKDVQERVDARFDANRHLAARAEAVAVRTTKRATKGQPKAVRREAVAQAREHAREQAHQDAEVRFAREFGANVRLSTGAAERELAQRQRATAVQRVTAARQADQAAKTAHDQALTNAKAAKAKAKTSPRLRAAGDAAPRRATRPCPGATRHTTVRDRPGCRQGARPGAVAQHRRRTGWRLRSLRLAGQGVDAAAQQIRDARTRVRDLDQQIAVERQRISRCPAREHQALLDAIHARGQTSAELASARRRADAARTVHIQAKQGMTHAALVSPVGAGRLFTHRADAANVARKLNEQGQELKQGTAHLQPVRFQLHEPNASGAVVSASAAAARQRHWSSPSARSATSGSPSRRSRRTACTRAVVPTRRCPMPPLAPASRRWQR